jgi:ribonuclease E
MSDALPDRPASPEGPPPAAPRPAPDNPPAPEPIRSSSEAGSSATGLDSPARRRRRGSRGGRNRSRSTGVTAASSRDAGPAGEPRDLPDSRDSKAAVISRVTGAPTDFGASGASEPAGGAPEGGGPPAAASAPIPNGSAPVKPKIGDSRPAPTAGAPGAPPPGPNRGAPKGRDAGGASGGAGRRNPARTGSGGGATAGGGSASSASLARTAPAAGSGGNGSRSDNASIIEESAEGRRRRRGRGGRGGRGPAGERTLDEQGEIDPETLERRRGRERKGRPVGRYLMLVHVQPNATQIAVLEGRSLIEHYVSRPADDAIQIDGNIYLGRVQNVLPGMEAAFVDIGTPKNAVLYRGDVRYDREDLESEGGGKATRGRGAGSRDARIEQLLKVGQTIVCQVTKNPIGTKGARLSQEVSLPGRFVVLIPGSDTYGISKRLADDERKRLRRILDDIRPPGHGLIVRTAAEGATAEELRRDVARLLRQWEDIDARARRTKAPALLYREPDMAVRVIREEFNNDYRGVVIDDQALFEEVRDYVASISPDLADRVEYAGDSDSPLPIFERYRVHEQVHKALDRKVWLPSGGSLIIERTEALTVIDVNTGKNVGTSNLEETVFRNNLEAAEEIARQLRLRDIGGIIVIDFIDMEIAANRNEVSRSFREALSRDKTRTQVFDISELGLVEMTRKRVSEGLVESFSETCPTCGGRGILLDQELL